MKKENFKESKYQSIRPICRLFNKLVSKLVNYLDYFFTLKINKETFKCLSAPRELPIINAIT